MIPTLPYYFDILFGFYSDILSCILFGTRSDIRSGICSDILFGILSGLLSDIHSDILSDIMYVLPFYLACSVPSMWSWRYIGPRGAPQHPELDEEHRDPHLAGREKGI